MKKAGKVAVVVAALLTLFCHSHLVAEEVVIEEGKHAEVGDFHCHSCFSKLDANAFPLAANGHDTIQMTAGELWQFFHEQGYQSVNELSLYLEMDQLDHDAEYSLSSLNVQIHAPNGELRTSLDMGNSNLVVPGYETSSFRPEAQLSFDLGYDFMKEYSSDSKELISFNISSESAVTPTFLISPRNDVFNSSHLSKLFAFVMFWGVVFLAIFHFMKPSSLREAASVESQAVDVLQLKRIEGGAQIAASHEATATVPGNSAARVG